MHAVEGLALGASASHPSLGFRGGPYRFDGFSLSGESRMDDGESAPNGWVACSDPGRFFSAIAVYLVNIVSRKVLWLISVNSTP